LLGSGVTDKDMVLSKEDLEGFCIEELILRAVGLRHALAGLAELPTASLDKNHPKQVNDILAELERLQANLNLLTVSVSRINKGHLTDKATRPPLMLVNPVSLPSRYAIENVTQKFSRQKA